MRSHSRARTLSLVVRLVALSVAMAPAVWGGPDEHAVCARLSREWGVVPLLACLGQWKHATLNPAQFSQIHELLSTSNGSVDHRVIAAALDVSRSQREDTKRSAETLSALLRHRAGLYHGRDKESALRLRAYLFVVLSEVGYPDSALPVLVDTLAHVDERSSPLELAAAARLVGTLGARGHDFVPYLLGCFGERFSEEEFSLERYEPEFPESEATTLQREAARALGKVLTMHDGAAIALLERLASSPVQSSVDPRLRSEARRALDAIVTRARSR